MTTKVYRGFSGVTFPVTLEFDKYDSGIFL